MLCLSYTSCYLLDKQSLMREIRLEYNMLLLWLVYYIVVVVAKRAFKRCRRYYNLYLAQLVLNLVFVKGPGKIMLHSRCVVMMIVINSSNRNHPIP